MLVSVIMPVYNVENYQVLVASVESILKQTLQDFELIICNDGSSNKKTHFFLKKIKKLDSRIKIISYRHNRGAAYCRNVGIKVSQGKYIAFQDDDDISAPSRLKKEVDFLESHKEYSYVGTNANVFYKRKIWGEYVVPKIPRKRDFLWSSPFINPSILFRANVLKSIGGFRISEETKTSEDYDLFLRLYAKGYYGFNIQEKLFNYRIEIEEERKKKYRSMRDRIREAKIRFKGFKLLHLGIVAFPFVLKPIIIGLIPKKIFYLIRKKQY
ncbi:MAG TPA: glycosyltransferase [Candidatus Dwaynia gallinarum]|nr:glycosyltransferase [Candidatus Dwaynia gallinarum]